MANGIKDLIGTGIVVPNKFGDFEILNYFKAPYRDGNFHPDPRCISTIRFVNKNPYNFNTIIDVYSSCIKLSKYYVNSIRDPYNFDVAGEGGCLGLFPAQFGAGCKEYQTWYDMIRRCYLPSCNMYYTYGAKGVTVDLTWRCYEYFLYQLPYIEGYEKWKLYPNDYELDKDIKQANVPIENRIYSLNTCCFIKKAYNRMERNRRINNYNYIGVIYTHRGTFKTIICGHIYGEYTSEIAAAARFNNEILALDPDFPKYLLNQVPYMTNAEIILNYQVR